MGDVEGGPAAGVTMGEQSAREIVAAAADKASQRYAASGTDWWRGHRDGLQVVLCAIDKAARHSADPGEVAALREKVGRLTQERDEARLSNRKMHRDIQQRERDFWRKARAEQRNIWLYLGHPGNLSGHTLARRKFAEEIETEQRNAIAAERSRDEAVAVLRRVEWAATDDGEKGGYEACCPACGWQKREGRHGQGCALAGALAADGAGRAGGGDGG